MESCSGYGILGGRGVGGRRAGTRGGAFARGMPAICCFGKVCSDGFCDVCYARKGQKTRGKIKLENTTSLLLQTVRVLLLQPAETRQQTKIFQVVLFLPTSISGTTERIENLGTENPSRVLRWAIALGRPPMQRSP